MIHLARRLILIMLIMTLAGMSIGLLGSIIYMDSDVVSRIKFGLFCFYIIGVFIWAIELYYYFFSRRE